MWGKCPPWPAEGAMSIASNLLLCHPPSMAPTFYSPQSEPYFSQASQNGGLQHPIITPWPGVPESFRVGGPAV